MLQEGVGCLSGGAGVPGRCYRFGSLLVGLKYLLSVLRSLRLCWSWQGLKVVVPHAIVPARTCGAGITLLPISCVDTGARLSVARSELALSVDPSLITFKHLNSSP